MSASQYYGPLTFEGRSAQDPNLYQLHIASQLGVQPNVLYGAVELQNGTLYAAPFWSQSPNDRPTGFVVSTPFNK
jgi:hypothetical protein